MVTKNEVLVEVQSVSKKFCTDLKLSLWYGLQDISRKMLGIQRKSQSQRKKEFWSVRDVSFQVRRGECLGLIGHNGAGKSTLLKVLNGLYNPDAGEVIMKGKVGALIELGAGFNPILTGRENIYNNAAILGFTKEEVDQKVNSIIDFSEIREFIDMPVQNYSSGMKVRLGFAVAAHLEPDVLIIDEVLAVGDLGFVLKCFKKIDELLPHTAVIFVSHNMPMISRICNEVILMDHGKVDYQGPDVSKGIDLYYGKFTQGETNVVFTDDTLVLEKIELQHADKEQNMPSIHWGDDLVVELSIALKDPRIELPKVHLTIYDKENRGVAAIMPENPVIKRVSDRIYYRFSHSKCQLSKGKYSINVVVGTAETFGVRLRVNHACNFVVKHPKEVWPPFLLESEIQIEQE